MVFLAVLLFSALIFAAIAIGRIMSSRRREALVAFAAQLGLDFNEEEDQAGAERLDFLRKLDEGENRYLYNKMSGDYQGHAVMMADYHYETYSHTKHGRQTHHHHLSVLTLRLPRTFPELLISPEGIFSKIAQAFGYDDIDLESAEFSRAFCVRCRDKKFAYDVCHPLMMEYLLAHPDLAIEFEGKVLALVFDPCLDVPELEQRLQQLVEIRCLMPDYLFTKS